MSSLGSSVRMTYTAEGLLRGDEVEWRHLQDRFSRTLRAYAGRQGLSENDTDDLVQSSLGDLIVSLRRGRYRPDLGPLTAFVFGIARNKMHAIRRREARVRLANAQSKDDRWDRVPATREDQATWNRAVARATVAHCLDLIAEAPERREAVEAFKQRHVLGLSAAAVSRSMGITVVRVYQHTRSVRDELRCTVKEVSVSDDRVWTTLCRSEAAPAAHPSRGAR